MEFVLIAPLLVAVCVAVVHVGAWGLAVTRANRIAFDAARDQAYGVSRMQALDRARSRLPDGATVVTRSAGWRARPAVEVEVRVPVRIMGWSTWASATSRMPREP
mgnify:FL=1